MKNTPEPVTANNDSAAAAKPAESVTMVADSGMGDVRIHDGVIATLARKAVLKVDGVSRLSGNTLVDNFAEIVGSRRMQSRAIAITVNENNQIDIEIKINIKMGYTVPDVAENVQKAVISMVEKITGMDVKFVHVLIQDVDDEIPDDDEEDEALN
ncbi:MAG: Asp23/Gls24 family envelope stress response protein [Lentisphaeria bacterium]|nr:Asp23/Gls24 family envelope stress response protein [Lentisphaeria bacterium]